jgi:hypothetical protein
MARRLSPLAWVSIGQRCSRLVFALRELGSIRSAACTLRAAVHMLDTVAGVRDDSSALLSRAQIGIGFRAVTGTGASKEVLRRVLRKHSLEDWLQAIGKLSKLVADLDPADARWDRELASRLGVLARATLKQIDSGGRFVNSATLNTLAREAFFHARVGTASPWPDEELGDIPRGLLSVVDLYEEEPPDRTSSMDTAIMSLLLRRIARPPLQMRNTLPRTHRLFVDLPNKYPQLLAGFDLDARCQALAGIDLARYLALAMTFYTRFATANRPGEWILTADYYAALPITRDEFAGTIRTVSATPNELRDAYQTEIDDRRTGLDDHRPLVLRPMCEIRQEAFIPIDFAALGERLVGDGVFWRLRPTDEQGKTEFVAAIGRLLEQHLWEVARDVYPAASRVRDERLFREKRFTGGRHGPDIVIFDDDAVAVCEIGANAINVRDTLHRGSIEAFDHDIDHVLLPRVRQVRAKIDAVRAGTLAFPRALSDQTRIEPVVCLLDGFPLAPFLRARIDDAIEKSQLLDIPNVGRLSILSAEEFELACATVELGRTTMTSLLSAHAHDQEMRWWPLRDYIRKLTGELPISQLMSREFDRVVDSITKALQG